MANAPKSPEQLAAEQSQQEMIDKAMNTAGFMEFLVAHPDHDPSKVSDPEFITEKFEVFNAKDEVKKGLKELWGGKFKEDLDMKLEPAEIKLIEERMDKKAIDHPEEVLELKKKLDNHAALPEDIAKKEARLAELGNVAELPEKRNALLADKKEFDLAKKYLGKGGSWKYASMWIRTTFKGFANITELIDEQFTDNFIPSAKFKKFKTEFDQAIAEQKAVKAVAGKHGEMDNEKIQAIASQIDGDIAKIEGTLAEVTELNGLMPAKKIEFENLRKELIGGAADVTELTKMIQDRVKAQFKDLLKKSTKASPKSIKDLIKAQETFDKLQKASTESELDINAFGKAKPEKWQKDIDDRIQEVAWDETMKVVGDLRLGNGAFSRLEKALEGFVTREKYGSKEGDDMKAFIVETITSVSNAYIGQDDTETKIKKAMCARIINKIESN